MFLRELGDKYVSIFSGFPDIPSIKVLHLCHMQKLQRVEKESLSGLTGLEELHISDNMELTYIDAFALPKINPKNGGTIWPFLRKVSYFHEKCSSIQDFLCFSYISATTNWRTWIAISWPDGTLWPTWISEPIPGLASARTNGWLRIWCLYTWRLIMTKHLK